MDFLRNLGETFNGAVDFVIEKNRKFSKVTKLKKQIKKVIDNKEKIEEWGIESRKFVERYHDHVKVAAQYLKIFENIQQT